MEVWKLILVGGWTNPFEKYARQVGNLPQAGLKIKHILNHHLGFVQISIEGDFSGPSSSFSEVYLWE